MTAKSRHLIASAVLLLSTPYGHAASIDSAINTAVQRADIARKAQENIERVDDSAREMERQYRQTLKEIEALEVYHRQLDKQIKDQSDELGAIESSIHQVALIERQITPLMLKMTDALERFVAADMPFEEDMRLKRVKHLREIMDRSDVDTAEKYRQVMSAYQDEINYGRTLKTYRSSLVLGEKTKEVDFLRVGRIALVYQSLDGEDIGIWNNTRRTWEPLDASHRGKITSALRIAREQAAPDLIRIPVSAPTAATPEKKP